ncbi:hypothetical protein KGQ20_25280 [Catenulispora sp. NF23]|uniref:PH domain-containing protein n=1 Tax=Catenulispora pinistramenti TaxID=2705254 RepID=A0ABS5L0U3_9ACTN|nr:hypothetical protein [Catenulispora pinistramenti]MBS2536080.1 hypothetical protein [Catenulispora pinistramenti]MBS2551943.1 hypothetical protein [Catenulispora pinistramenti]
MKQVILRPAGGLGYLKAIIVFADLAFLGLPFLVASTHQSAIIVAVIAVVSVVCIAAGTFLGWLALDMRIEVEPDAVRIYYFWPVPGVIAREAILDARITRMNTGRSYAPSLALVGNRYRLLLPLSVRSEYQAQEQLEKLKQALRDVAPVDLSAR